MCYRGVNGLFAQQIAHGVAVAAFLQILHVALVDDFASQTSRIRADVDDIVGGTDDFFVVLYHYNRIAQLLQLAQYLYEAVGITTMETDTRFIQYI